MLLQSIMDTATSASEEKTKVRKDRDFIVNKNKGLSVSGFTQGPADVQSEASSRWNGRSNQPHDHSSPGEHAFTWQQGHGVQIVVELTLHHLSKHPYADPAQQESKGCARDAQQPSFEQQEAVQSGGCASKGAHQGQFMTAGPDVVED